MSNIDAAPVWYLIGCRTGQTINEIIKTQSNNVLKAHEALISLGNNNSISLNNNDGYTLVENPITINDNGFINITTMINGQQHYNILDELPSASNGEPVFNKKNWGKIRNLNQPIFNFPNENNENLSLGIWVLTNIQVPGPDLPRGIINSIIPPPRDLPKNFIDNIQPPPRDVPTNFIDNIHPPPIDVPTNFIDNIHPPPRDLPTEMIHQIGPPPRDLPTEMIHQIGPPPRDLPTEMIHQIGPPPRDLPTEMINQIHPPPRDLPTEMIDKIGPPPRDLPTEMINQIHPPPTHVPTDMINGIRPPPTDVPTDMINDIHPPPEDLPNLDEMEIPVTGPLGPIRNSSGRMIETKNDDPTIPNTYSLSDTMYNARFTIVNNKLYVITLSSDNTYQIEIINLNDSSPSKIITFEQLINLFDTEEFTNFNIKASPQLIKAIRVFDNSSTSSQDSNDVNIYVGISSNGEQTWGARMLKFNYDGLNLTQPEFITNNSFRLDKIITSTSLIPTYRSGGVFRGRYYNNETNQWNNTNELTPGGGFSNITNNNKYFFIASWHINQPARYMRYNFSSDDLPDEDAMIQILNNFQPNYTDIDTGERYSPIQVVCTNEYLYLLCLKGIITKKMMKIIKVLL